MKYICITNSPEKAVSIENSRVDYIMVDLEINGKVDRQGHLNTLISNHSLADVYRIKRTLNNTKLLVRVNPIFDGSKDEIDKVINNGADALMLPMFYSEKEVQNFIDLVDGRAEVWLLFETPSSIVKCDRILSLNGIDRVHLGLNDLHISMKLSFMFELLSCGLVDYFCQKCVDKGMKYGFGGIAPLGRGAIDSSFIASEHIRLGSSSVILSRDFHNDDKLIHNFEDSVEKLKSHFSYLSSLQYQDLINNQREFVKLVNNLVDKL